MPSNVLISNSTSISAGTVTLTGVTGITGPGGERPVINTTGLEDTVSTQDTGILSYSKGISITGGTTTATFGSLNTLFTADTTFTMSKIKGGKTASGTYKVTMLEQTAQVNDKVTFNATFVPTGDVTMQN